MIRIDGIDHLVLTVSNIKTSYDFYSRVLGMEVVGFGDDRRALRFGKQKINLHRADAPIAPHALGPTVGEADLCFFMTTPLAEVVAHLVDCGIAIIERPVARVGAVGSAGKPSELTDVTSDGFPACVWELEVHNFECCAWMQTVLKNSDGPNLECYLGGHLNTLV